MFELFYAFSTEMERAMVLKKVRECEFPESFVKEWPKEVRQTFHGFQAALILCLLAPEPQKRPTAAQILTFTTLRMARDDSVASMASSMNRLDLVKIKELNDRVELLLKENEALKIENAGLKDMIKQLTSSAS